MIAPATPGVLAGEIASAILEPGDPRWDSFLADAPHDIYATPGYAELSASSDGGRPVAVLAGSGPRQILVPLLIRDIPSRLGGDRADEPWLDAASPYGYPGIMRSDALRADPEGVAFIGTAMRSVVAALGDAGVISLFLRLHPLLPIDPAALAGLGTVIEHGHTVSVDLDRPVTGDELRDILPDISRNHRRDLNRLAQQGFTCDIVGTDDDAAVATFLEIYTETMDRLEAGQSYYVDAAYVRRLAVAAGDGGSAVIALVRQGDAVAAVGLLTVVGGIVQDVFGGARSELAALAPTKLKIPAVVRWGRANGHHVYHLGGGLGGAEDELFRFKAGFSRRHHPYHTARIVIDRERFLTLERAWSARAGSISADPDGFFPPYRAPVAGEAPED